MDRHTLLRELVKLCDSSTVVGTFLIALWVNGHVLGRQVGPISEYAWLLWVVVLAWMIGVRVSDLYDTSAYESLWTLERRLVESQAFAALFQLSAVYLTRVPIASRRVVECFVGFAFVTLSAEKIAVWKLAEYMRLRRGAQVTRRLIVCRPQGTNVYSQALTRYEWGHGEVVGYLLSTTAETGNRSLDNGSVVLGRVSALPRVVLQQVVDEIVVVEPLARGETEQIALWCKERGLNLRIMLELPAFAVGGYKARDLGEGIYLFSPDVASEDALRMAVKRTVDVLGGLVGLMAYLPVYLWYRRKLMTETSASAMFAQTRVGRNGRRFTLYKLRTMHASAERRQKELERFNQMRGHMFKVKDDPRVTATGKLLRERHLDELPQFWNVLKGEMSLVGARPPTVEEVENYNPYHYRRLAMKPGITGLWQVKGNAEINDFEEVVKLDCDYIEHWSLWLDFKIIARTVAKVVSRRGW